MNSEQPNTNSHAPELLSQAGKARRVEMRAQLQAAFVQFHARRQRTRRALAWSPAIVLLMVAGAWWTWSIIAAGNSSKLLVESRQPPVQDTLPSSTGVSAHEPSSLRVEFELINDDQLLDLLAEAGHPSALAWFKGKPVVVPLSQKSAL